jgi:GTP pyrophosphokinase
VIDFAYRIHSQIGHHCTGARVAGRLVPLRYVLQNGDTVEIITTERQTPSRDWLKIVKTPRAKERIRAFLKTQQAVRSLEVGREILQRDLVRFDLDVERLTRDGTLERVAQELAIKSAETLVREVGYGKLTTREVLERLVPSAVLEEGAARTRGALQRILRAVSRRPDVGGVRVSGAGDVLTRFARCCDPLPGERIVGFITRGRGVTVHATGCPKALEPDPQRRVQCVWDPDSKSPRPARLEVLCVDEPGLLAAISKTIAHSGINIRKAEVRSIQDHKAVATFEIMVEHVDDMSRLMRNLTRVRGVTRVERLHA